MKIRNVRQQMHLKHISLVGVLLIVAAAIVGPIYSVRSSSLSKRSPSRANGSAAASSRAAANVKSGEGSSSLSTLLTPTPSGETIVTYESTCTTPKDSFDLGETVCAVITGAPLGASRPARRIAWVSPYGSLTQGGTITTDPQNGFYNIPAGATQTFTDAGGGTTTVDNRGVWRISTMSALDGSLVQSAYFTVHDPVKKFVDLSVSQSATAAESNVGAGSGSVFKIFVSNRGPDNAQSVVLSDTVPANTTFSSMVETTSLGFVCGVPSAGVFTCAAPTLAAGATAEFTFAYDVDGGTAAGTVISNVATVSSSNTPCGTEPCEVRPDDNTSTAFANVPQAVAGETCTLNCHENFSVIANTTQGGNPGAIVTFGAAAVFGNCGAVAANPASGSFFGLGTTVVSVTSENGGGSCSFTITVVEGTPPTITCPADKSATDDGSGSFTFVSPAIGTPTTNPTSGVVVTFERSDDIPATYDSDGNLVTAAVVHGLYDPYPAGTTGITWTATDSNGLTASCTQRVLVHAPCASDTEAPTITAPADVTASTGPNSTTCGVVLDDELGQATAHDDCSATVTVSGIPPGNLFPVGTTTVTYTATDGGGRTATATQHVTVTDNTPPVIFAPANASYTCPEQVPALSASQAFGPDVNGDPDPTRPVFDNCGSPAVTASQSSSGVGSAASPLVITRTYTALDSHGNTASAVQVITVTDSTAPSFTSVPPAVTAYTGAGATSCDTVVSNATLGTAVAQDNCAGVTVSRSPSGNTFPVGVTTVTWTATDWAGNTTSATQTVTVIDNTAPVITTNGSTPSMWPPDHTMHTFQVTDFVTSVFDNCGSVSVGDVVIAQVTSDELDDATGGGDGNTVNDIQLAANCKSVQLRSERAGSGDGRVYTITFRLTDTHGNVTTATARVLVNHDTGAGPETVIDSGSHYTVSGSCP
jgi:uncharacterized repeat protein (TIGR01451 family)